MESEKNRLLHMGLTGPADDEEGGEEGPSVEMEGEGEGWGWGGGERLWEKSFSPSRCV